MKKAQFETLKKALLEKGYKLYDQHWHHEDYCIGKGFHKEDNKWEEDRNAYQIIISVYDYSDASKPLYSRLPDNMKDSVGLEVHVDMSRTIDERFDFVFSWHDDDEIREIERLAEGFYLHMCMLCPNPREEKY